MKVATVDRRVIAAAGAVVALAIGGAVVNVDAGTPAAAPRPTATARARASRRHVAPTPNAPRPTNSTPPPTTRGSALASTAMVLVTTADRSQVLNLEPPVPITADGTGTAAGPGTGPRASIAVDATVRDQPVDGVGAALTESTVQLLDTRLSPSSRQALLEDLFGPGGAHLGELRLPLSATDFAGTEYTYDDLAPGGVDPALAHFSIAHDEAALIPMLRQVLAVNPHVRIVASEWSAPGWMKSGNRASNDGLIHGQLRAGNEALLGRYLARVTEAYARDGISFDAITVQNEPTYSPADYPSMLLSAAQEAKVAASAARALARAGLHTKVLVHDDNWDTSGRAASILADPATGSLVAGTAFHCYRGDPSAQTVVHDAYPSKDIYLTECTGTFDHNGFGSNFLRDTDTLMIGATRNWARTVLLWNLALDEQGRPHLGGCFACRGVVTIDSVNGEITRNEEYYALAQFARGVQASAVRIDSTEQSAGVRSVAFLNPDGTRAVLLSNDTTTDVATTVHDGARSFTYLVPARAVATITWS